VLVSSELGEILGEAFPERGVLFSFEPAKEPGKATMSVTQIILEPISAEAFTLRAETNLDNDPDSALADLEQSLKLVPSDARANWLRAKVLASKGQIDKAAASASQAVASDPVNSHYQLTYAQILNQSGKYAEAVAAAKQVLEAKDNREHVKAQALCLLGDLAATGPEHDYRAAMAYHAEAIKTADPLASSPHPAIRLAAKEVLIDAHLGAASDIAWGKWKQKETAVPKWLGRASAFADEMIANDGGSDQQRFRVAVRALSTYVGLHGKLDPTDWVRQAVETSDRLIAATKDEQRKEQINWDLGMALYDAVQTYQARGAEDEALLCGEQAIARLEQGGAEKQNTLAYAYLLGRVQFRLGAIYAVGRKDHKSAVAWFDKAVPLLSKPIPDEALADLGRHGETFVSMAVSYWETGQRDKALQLTQRGASLMEQAVKDGTADRSILAVPYNNLATMHRALGEEGQASQWAEMAAKSKDTIQK
jgi:tetratricopeptide (TPR) repeat protein